MHDLARYIRLPEYLAGRIKGQTEAVRVIAKAVQRGELGVKRDSRPKGNFLLLGPTGTGKTEITLAVADFLTGSEDPEQVKHRIARFDMAEYQNRSGVERLLGANKAEQGLLGDEIDRLEQSSESSAILFDEIEKAHPDIMTIFLAAMDAGRVTMSNGRTKDLRNLYLFFTSNLGSGEASRMEASSDAVMSKAIEQVARQKLRPELFARFDERVIFRKLSFEASEEIAQKLLRKELDALCSQKKVQISSGGSVLRHLVKIGFHKLLGARPMRAAVERSVGEAWTKFILARLEEGRGVEPGEHLTLVVHEDALELRKE